METIFHPFALAPNGATVNKILSGAIPVVLALALASPVALGGGGDERMSDHTRDALTAKPHEKVKLIVTYRQPPGLDDEDKVKGKGGQVNKKFKSIRGHAIELPAREAESLLEQNPNIARFGD